MSKTRLLPVSVRVLALTLPLALVAAAPAPERSALDGRVPVIDLRVGLSSSLAHRVPLAKALGQAGYIELARGGVAGVVLPFPLASRGEARVRDPAPAFFAMRDALAFSQRFKWNACNERAPGIGAWLSLEAPQELASEPEQLGVWTARGARVVAIAGSRDNDLTTSAAPAGPGAVIGLTAAGRKVVQRILAAGALVDASNTSELALDEVVEMAERAGSPVIASHSNARALADSPWNLSDSQIRSIARTGGVVGVTARRGLLAPGRSPTIRHLVEQIRHMVRVAGPEHVAIGSSFEDGAGSVTGFKSAADFPRLARALRERGMSEDAVERVFYKNARRVLCPAKDAVR
jgi:membrane dipeptidase